MSQDENGQFFLDEESIEEIVNRLAEEPLPETPEEQRIFDAGRLTVYKMILSNFIAEPFPDEEVPAVWAGIVANRNEINRKLGRNAGFRVAALDYLFNQSKKITSPTILENRRYSELVDETRLDIKTGLFNARSFYQITDQEIERSRRYGLFFSLLLLDMDHFKLFNDTLGHITGDKLIISLSLLLRDELRNVDFAGRFGGDEFCILLPQTGREDALRISTRIRERFAAMFRKDFPEAEEVTLSIGIALYPFHRRTRQELFSCADKALYTAKASGRNRASSDPELNSSILLKQGFELAVSAEHQSPLIYKRMELNEDRMLLPWPAAAAPEGEIMLELRGIHDSYHTLLQPESAPLLSDGKLAVPFTGIEELRRRLLTTAEFTSRDSLSR